MNVFFFFLQFKGKIIPALPKQRMFGTDSQEHGEQLREGLERFLNRVLGEHDFACANPLLLFLEADEQVQFYSIL
jgi:hypothetical protein